MAKRKEITDEEFFEILEGKNPKYSKKDVEMIAEKALDNVLKEFGFDD